MLKAFARAALLEPDRVEERSAEVRSAVGGGGWLEAVSTVAAFEGLVRVADATGIELDDQVYASSVDFREALGIDCYPSAANTRKDIASIVLEERYDTALDLFR